MIPMFVQVATIVEVSFSDPSDRIDRSTITRRVKLGERQLKIKFVVFVKTVLIGYRCSEFLTRSELSE